MQVRTVSTKWLTLTAMVVLVALVLTWFEPAWDEVLRSLQLGTMIASPLGALRH